MHIISRISKRSREVVNKAVRFVRVRLTIQPCMLAAVFSQHLQILDAANASLNRHKIRGRPAALGLHHDSSNGSSSSGDATPNDTISIFTTGGGSSGSKRLRESEPLHDCERQVASTSIAALQLSSPTAVPHGISLDDNSFLPQNNHLENGSRPTEGRHCERPSWYTTRTRHLEPNNQYLPPLSDILDDNGQSARSRLPLAPGSFAIAKSSHFLHPANKVTERTGGYKSPKVYLGGSSILSTHVWVSSDKSDILYAKVPMRGVSGANGEDAAVESSHRLPSHSTFGIYIHPATLCIELTAG